MIWWYDGPSGQRSCCKIGYPVSTLYKSGFQKLTFYWTSSRGCLRVAAASKVLHPFTRDRLVASLPFAFGLSLDGLCLVCACVCVCVGGWGGGGSKVKYASAHTFSPLPIFPPPSPSPFLRLYIQSHALARTTLLLLYYHKCAQC